MDAQAPELSEIWRKFGGNGCVSTEILGNLRSNINTPHCVSRNFETATPSQPRVFATQYTPEMIQFISDTDSFDQFRRNLEGLPHNSVHAGIGGDMNYATLSPNDPIFYMHHRNVDRIWALWQSDHPDVGMSYSGNISPGSRDTLAKRTDVMHFFGLGVNHVVSQALDTQSGTGGNLMCFRYSASIRPSNPSLLPRQIHVDGQDLHNVTTPDASDRENMYNLRVPLFPSDEYYRRWNYSQTDLDDIREREKQIVGFIGFMNSMPLKYPYSLGEIHKARKHGWKSKRIAEDKAAKEFMRILVYGFLQSQEMSIE